VTEKLAFKDRYGDSVTRTLQWAYLTHEVDLWRAARSLVTLRERSDPNARARMFITERLTAAIEQKYGQKIAQAAMTAQNVFNLLMQVRNHKLDRRLLENPPVLKDIKSLA
jgi:hypothetical protein